MSACLVFQSPGFHPQQGTKRTGRPEKDWFLLVWFCFLFLFFLRLKNLCGLSARPFPCTGGSHGAQPEWHDLEASLPQGLAAASGHLIQPAGTQDPQAQGSAGESAPHCPAPRVRTHQAHREVPHSALPHQGPSWPGLQPGGTQGGWYP